LIALQPDTANWYTLKSGVHLDWGRPEEAREVLERAPRTDKRHLLWAWWYLEHWTGNHQAALHRLAEMPEVLELGFGKFPRVYLEAWTFDAMNQPERARASYAAALRVIERILRKTPEDELARRLLPDIHARLGRKEDAIREAKAAVERERKTGNVRWATESVMGLAFVYSAVGEPELALDQLEFLLSVPSLVSYGRLRFAPELRALHGHPRFEKLLAEAKQPLPLPPS
jgi:tetratricopeptide (TPR) repeat protein